MSRGVRDLRDLICVSRLTFRASDDEEEIISDDERMSRDFDRVSLSSATSTGTDGLTTTDHHISPDSGCVTNGSTPPDTAVDPAEINKPEETKPTFITNTKIDRPRKKKRKEKWKQVDTLPPRHEFPKKMPLPPVRPVSSNSSVSELDVDNVSQPILGKKKPSQPDVSSGNFDNMLCYMDATVVSNWLTRANTAVIELTKFCNSNDNFVQFAHFWLSDFPDLQKKDIFELEHSILLEELGFAFAVGREQRKVSHRDLLDLIGALFREYPKKILSAKGPYMFLNYLEFLSSEKKADYKKILSDVKCSTKNKQYAQWLLATRSFALVSMWSAIVNFYRNLMGRIKDFQPAPSALSHSDSDINLSRVYQAIRLGYSDVVHYYIVSGHINPQQVDSHNRTFIFTAVMHNQLDVLNYLMKRVRIFKNLIHV